MRFLCLHGKGTNSQVFEIQLAALRHRLGSEHVYEFLDASFECEPAPGTEIYASPNDTFLSWIDEESVQNTTDALNDFEAYIKESEPFDGVIAFSQAAGFVASYMIRQLRETDPMNALLSPPFKCAIFFCSAPVTKGGEFAKYLDPVLDKHRIQIPTAHIWGRNDRQVQGPGSWLVDLCAKDGTESYVHEGAHEVPGMRMPDALRGTVRVIQKTIERATFSC
ncbi:hypothetical protein BU23DRAFT_462841 [Bimuria novae-zelandiae CBS 107.79]|uniref:Serine hydrolase domain-containing protein n=1 Tax=Bimuria novae-zelandiae CBS 107.79 TaxID=1447943 RepID=A0A6A5VA82_9PLEO|nr:hypothetical protein BU23DRAFT_462841 [Bimuria novae-zelandiae CBS 107.79]